VTEITLELEGMTCASCASRIERRLNELDGVQASVNLATEKAAVSYDASSVAVEDLVGAVEDAGYGASLARRAHAEPRSALRSRLIVATGLTVPLAFIAMVPALRFDGWE